MVLDSKLLYTPDNDYCPVRATLALLGQKWVPHIIYELMQGKRRFNELAAAIGGCNSRTLGNRLKKLERLGIVERRIIATMPPWVEYALSRKGQDLALAVKELADWGQRHMADLRL